MRPALMYGFWCEQVFGAEWDPQVLGGQHRFVTYGIKHLKLWALQRDPQQMFAAYTCSWGGAPPQDVLCAVFLPPGLEDGVGAISRSNKVHARLLSAPLRLRRPRVCGASGAAATGRLAIRAGRRALTAWDEVRAGVQAACRRICATLSRHAC